MRREWLEKDYYEILGVDRGASEKEITAAYRRLAKKHHPDNNPGDAAAEARFKEVSEANAVLSDAEQRSQYDQAREMFSRGTFVGDPGGGAQYVRIDDLGDLGDLFGGGLFGGLGDLFGAGGRRAQPRSQRGGDVEAEVSLSFHEAVQGTTRTLTVQGPDGRRQVTVKIPAGVNDGARIRLRGQGQPGRQGGTAGDLYVRVHAGSHPLFARSGRDLKVRLPISFTEAALGADIAVPTLDGKVTLRVPPGTSSGRTFRVKGKGVATGKGTGDLLVTVEVAVPKDLSPEARSLLEQLRRAEEGHNPRAHLGV
ncbi:MAG TPA: DnaJ C-terminal domain-containing protein [Acidimicrobiia bacterium]|nr:DnaJ C-terminal domain-containing protein [Acidimicrobiia bacterium]